VVPLRPVPVEHYAPRAAGSFGDSATAIYAGLAAASALLCTGLLHLFLLEVPRPITFFLWITILADIIVAAAPFTQPASIGTKVFTAVINILVGVAVISLLCAVARSAVRNGQPTGQARAERSR
jgi:hypothetical protein